MDEIAQRGQGVAAVRIACQDRATGRGTGAVNHPVVRAFFGCGALDATVVGHLDPDPGLIEPGGKPRRLKADRSGRQPEQVEHLYRYILRRDSISESRL